PGLWGLQIRPAERSHFTKLSVVSVRCFEVDGNRFELVRTRPSPPKPNLESFTVVFASWDAEEYGLVGSTEWGEDFPEWISKHAVAYLNVDVSVSGSRWQAGGSPSLAHLIKKSALDVPHPTVEGKTLWDARHDEGPFGIERSNMTIDIEFLNNYITVEKEHHASSTGVNPLGSGSDYTVFLQRLGPLISVEDLSTRVSFEVPSYHNLRRAIKKLQRSSLELDKEKSKAEKEFKHLLRKLHSPHGQCKKSHHFVRHAADWVKKVFGVEPHHYQRISRPEVDSWTRFLEFDGGDVRTSAAGAVLPPKHSHLIKQLIKAAKRVVQANKKIIAFERGFISQEGIKDREWYKHLGVAPGKWLGERSTALLKRSRLWSDNFPCPDGGCHI
ncbi:hypothetical protein H0H81_004950, partial [Sphagnurus paluster]